MLNEKIVYYRKKNMLTQEELAYQLNVSRQTVTKWETGTIYPNIEYLIKLSNLFGVSILQEKSLMIIHIKRIIILI